mmetsp:Transcript_22476/g.45035  ORF Transcript_22476/g.45035 Transcript_22476/m.45035 type:complete len:721 (+) Transcript_22476:161-2323(+)
MHLTSSAVLLLAATGANAAVSTTKATSDLSQLQMRNKFMSAMKYAQPTASQRRAAKQKQHARQLERLAQEDKTPSLEAVAEEMKGDSMSAQWLKKKIASKAKFVSPEEVRAREQQANGGERKLQNGNNYGYNAYNKNNGNGNANNQRNQYDENWDGTDDWFAANGEWENVFGFDVTEYSMSYLKCAAVKQFDDEVAATEDTTSVFATEHFAIFRFCPARTCDGYEEDGEDENAGNRLRRRLEGGNANYRAAMYGNGNGNNAYGNGNANYNRNANCVADENGQMPEGCCVVNEDGEMPEGCCVPDENGTMPYGCEAVYGAAGEGCQSNYGEYMLEIGDYLEIMSEYRQQRFEAYCMYCEECSMAVYQQWLQWSKNQNYDYNQRKLPAYEDKEAWQRELETMRRELGDFDALSVCPEYNACKIYEDVCGEDIDSEYAEYFECTAVENKYGQVAYVGPHCAEDGVTVTLGLYSDENCYEYIGKGANMRNFLGDDLPEDALYDYVTGSLESVVEYWNPMEQLCIPCNSADQLYEDEGMYYHDDGNYDNDEINELCENLYLTSARCDKHYRSYSSKTKNEKYYDKALMDLSCDFIDSVVEGNFDEDGFVILDEVNGRNYLSNNNTGATSTFLKNNLYYQEYGHYIEEVTPMQVFGLVASILAVAILGLWSAALHKSLTKNGGAWRPRRGINSANAAGVTDPVDISRQNSGIVMGRSRSNMSYYAN